MTKLRVLDLFSGIGGFSLGLERTSGFETVAFCEIEPFPRKILAKHWPNVPCYEDVRTITADRLRADGIAVDVICGGFPCQDISNAGKRAGIEGERSGLWSEIVRLVRDLRPRFLIVENVAALLDLGLGRVLSDLAAVGYDAQWHCIPASHLGAPHRRDRVWIIANPTEGAGQLLAFGKAERFSRQSRGSDWVNWRDWADQPCLCGEDDGISNRVDRLAACGNAVVPQIPELIGNAILESLSAQQVAA